jgi:uncharacterized protein
VPQQSDPNTPAPTNRDPHIELRVGSSSASHDGMELVRDTAHRPWAIPPHSWILKQQWNEVLFAHWRVGRDRLRELIPSFLEIDTFDNEAWLGIVPFRLTNLSPRGIPPLPWISAFDEINVRTYVTHKGRPGVYFFSLDANSSIAVAAARTFFHLPYFLATIAAREQQGTSYFKSRRTRSMAEFNGTYAPAGPVFQAQPGTVDYWLTERYCLYTQYGTGHAYRVEIHHRPWLLQQATAHIAINTMNHAAAIRLPLMAPLLHFARRQDVLTWPPTRLF